MRTLNASVCGSFFWYGTFFPEKYLTCSAGEENRAEEEAWVSGFPFRI